MTVWKKQNYRNIKKISDCQGLKAGEKGWIGGTQGTFKAVKLFCTILEW